MNNLNKGKITVKTNARVNSVVKVDKKLDEIKQVKSVSNKIEEVNKYVHTLKLSF